MKTILCAGVLVLSLIFTPSSSSAGQWSYNLNGVLGGKFLKEDDWGQFDDQFQLGFMADVRKKDWPVSLAANLLYSSKDKSHYNDSWRDDRYRYTYYAEEGYTAELNLGLKKIWSLPQTWNIYVAGGATVIYGGVEITREDNLNGDYRDTDNEDDVGFGYWGALGVYKTIKRHFNLGLDLRYSHAKIRLYHEDRNAGGFHVGLILGFCWDAK
ncbi:MAG: outer membrane beta-barrel protein [Desulfobacterales bacterium]|nr:outer membrane beta-barrel protein [Desulfobacterales bacterium]